MTSSKIENAQFDSPKSRFHMYMLINSGGKHIAHDSRLW